MELRMIGTVFLLVIAADNLVTGTDNVPVGTTCVTGDTCITDAECDKVYGKCLLKQDQDCTTHTDSCVFGASCSTKCACGAGYTTATSKLCEPKNPGTVGTPCTAGGKECTTPNSECSTLLACKCKAGYSLDITNGQCTSGQNRATTPGYITISLLSATCVTLSLARFLM